MLTLTPSAATVVKEITDRAPQDAGLRISTTDPEQLTFDVMIVDEPQPDDLVVVESGARVFVGQAASETLGDKVLDALVADGGAVQFTIGVQ
jgi:Fe-S cluster assembly iron-binding protein IscA